MSEQVAHLCYQYCTEEVRPGSTITMINCMEYWPICGRESIITNRAGKRGRRICKDCLQAKRLGKCHAKPHHTQTRGNYA